MDIKNRKFISFFALLFICIAICSCDAPKSDSYWISPTHNTVGAEAGTIKLAISAKDSWTLTSNASWAVPGKTSGLPIIETDTVIITFERNRLRNERKAILQFGIDREGNTPREFTLTQEGVGHFIDPALDSVRCYSGETQYSINIESNMKWSVKTFPEWVDITKVEFISKNPGDDFELWRIDFTVKNNTSPYYRDGEISISDNEGFAVDSGIFIYQDGNSSLKSDSLALVNLYKNTQGSGWKRKWNISSPISSWEGVKLDSIEASNGKQLRVVALSLSDNNMVGELASEMFEIPFLRLLWLDKNYLSGDILYSIEYLQDMQNLKLGFNDDLKGAFSSKVSNMRDIVSISLGKAKFYGSLPEELGSLESLTLLEINDNEFTGQLPASLGGNRNLKTFILKNNFFSGVIPENYKKNINWYDWDPETMICPQRSGGFSNCSLW